MDKALEKKLLITDAKKVAVINAPIRLGQVDRKKDGPVDVLLVFVKDKEDISMSVDQAISSLGPKGVLWFAYPKKSSGIKTDISRDSGWTPLAKNKFVPVTQVAIDETWSALRFKPVDQIPKLTRKTAIGQRPSKHALKRTLELPTDFQQLLSKRKKAGEFFQSLSFTNRKEYVVWLASAKKPETKQKRLKDAIEKLLSEKRNPSEK
jgi:Bacteriocin-protection, YdeI or OmpD-Associated